MGSFWRHANCPIDERTPPSYFINEKVGKGKLTDYLQPSAPTSPQLQSQVNLHDKPQQNHDQLPNSGLEQPPPSALPQVKSR